MKLISLLFLIWRTVDNWNNPYAGGMKPEAIIAFLAVDIQLAVAGIIWQYAN